MIANNSWNNKVRISNAAESACTCGFSHIFTIIWLLTEVSMSSLINNHYVEHQDWLDYSETLALQLHSHDVYCLKNRWIQSHIHKSLTANNLKWIFNHPNHCKKQTCRCLVRDKELQDTTKSLCMLFCNLILLHIRGNASVLPCLTLNKTSKGMKRRALDKNMPTQIPDTAWKALLLYHVRFQTYKMATEKCLKRHILTI